MKKETKPKLTNEKASRSEAMKKKFKEEEKKNVMKTSKVK